MRRVFLFAAFIEILPRPPYPPALALPSDRDNQALSLGELAEVGILVARGHQKGVPYSGGE